MAIRKKKRERTSFGRTYTVYFLRDEQAGGYTAHIPALGIVTEGETLKAAQAMARDAIEGRIAVLRELGEPVPDDVPSALLKV